MDIAELDRESAELLPDRQALGCWNYGWHNTGYGHGCDQGWSQGWSQGHGQGWSQQSWTPQCGQWGA